MKIRIHIIIFCLALFFLFSNIHASENSIKNDNNLIETNYLSRGEFIYMLIDTQVTPITNKHTLKLDFADMKIEAGLIIEDDIYTQKIILNKDIINTYEDNTIRLDNKITKEEASYIIYNFIKKSPIIENYSYFEFNYLTSEDPIDDILIYYPDNNKISPFAKESIAYLLSVGGYKIDNEYNLLEPKSYVSFNDAKELIDATKTPLNEGGYYADFSAINQKKIEVIKNEKGITRIEFLSKLLNPDYITFFSTRYYLEKNFNDEDLNESNLVSTNLLEKKLLMARDFKIIDEHILKNFRGNDAITREECSDIVYKFLKSSIAIGKTYSDNPDLQILDYYYDSESISLYAKESIAALISLELYETDENFLYPQSYISENEADILINNVFSIINFENSNVKNALSRIDFIDKLIDVSTIKDFDNNIEESFDNYYYNFGSFGDIVFKFDKERSKESLLIQKLEIANNFNIAKGYTIDKYNLGKGLRSEYKVFKPDNAISKEDMYVMTYNLLKSDCFIGDIEIPSENLTEFDEYFDWNKVSPYARDAVATMLSLNLYEVDEKKYLNPQKNVTSYEADMLLNKIKKL